MSDDQGALFHRNLTEYRDTWVPTEPNPATPAEEEGTDFIEEGNKKQSAQRAILSALISGPRTNKELAEIGGHRFSARLHELRAAGYDIETERSGKVFVYRLVS